MSKKALSFILTLILTTSIFFSSIPAVFAEDVEQPSTDPLSAFSETTVAPSAEETTAPEPTVSKARYPVLTVNAISNYFGKAYAEYNEFTREVTVIFHLKASKRIVTTNWKLTYDSTILSVDPEKNKKENICPIMKDDCAVLFEDGLITYAATDLKMFDFTAKESPFVQITFDVAPLTELDSEITKVDLTVDDLWVSEPNPVTGESVSEKEVVLVANSKVIESKSTDAILVSKITTLTPSTFVEPASEATPDEAFTTIPATQPTVPETVASTQPATTPAKEEPKEENDNYLLWTGEWYVALLILGVLLVCSTILFIMRKRDIYNNP